MALGVWGCVLLAYLLRPVVMVPKEGPPLFPVARLDTTGGEHPACRLYYLPVTLDR